MIGNRRSIMEFLEILKEYSININSPIYLVGGAVRDKFLDRNISDYDFATLDYVKFAEYFCQKTQGHLIKLHHDVYRVVVNKIVFDFCNLKGNTIEEDLKTEILP